MKKIIILIDKIYTLAILLYLIPITQLYIRYNIIGAIGILFPLIIRHTNPKLIVTELLRRLGIKSKIKLINGEFLNFKLAMEKLLKEYNLDLKVEITNDEYPNMVVGKSTLYITKGFAKLFSSNLEWKETQKILPLLGHELTHQRRWNTFIGELLISIMIVTLVFIGIIFLGIFNLFIAHYLYFLSLYLIIFYTFRKNEYEADKGGVIFAKDKTGLIEFLKKVDKRYLKGYTIWDKFDELFDFHPHPVNRIKKLEKMNI